MNLKPGIVTICENLALGEKKQNKNKQKTTTLGERKKLCLCQPVTINSRQTRACPTYGLHNFVSDSVQFFLFI